MTIHITLSPALLEFACHFFAAWFYMAIGLVAEMNHNKPGDYALWAWLFAIIAIILTCVGASL